MSLIDIEKNDVDISKLFAYKKELTLLIPGTTDEITLHQRLVGDSDNNKARVYGLRESGKLRSNLNNTKWEDRIAYIPDLSKLLKDDLVEVVLSLVIQDLSIRAINETTIKEPKEPSGDSSLEEQEKYQDSIDSYREDFSKQVAETLETKIQAKRKELGGYTKEELRSLYERALVDQHCQEQFGKSYLEMSSFFGTYSDPNFKIRAFKKFEDFLNAPTNVKESIVSSYADLQINGVTLKKSQGVMR